MTLYASSGQFGAGAGLDWLRVLRRYVMFAAVAHLLWDFAHLPLYSIWLTCTAGQLAFAAVHCSGGDILITLSTITLALFLVGRPDWPHARAGAVLGTAIAFGVGYTIFSEWLNIEVRQAWAYRDLMPVIPLVDAGLSPVIQWIAIPLAAWWWAVLPGETRSERPCHA